MSTNQGSYEHKQVAKSLGDISPGRQDGLMEAMARYGWRMPAEDVSEVLALMARAAELDAAVTRLRSRFECSTEGD